MVDDPRPYSHEIEAEIAHLRENPEEVLPYILSVTFPYTLEHLELGSMKLRHLWHFRFCTLDLEGLQIGDFYFRISIC